MSTIATPRAPQLRRPETVVPGTASLPPAQRVWLRLGCLLVVAALAFTLELGRSSLFIDEVFSWSASRGGLDDMLVSLRYAEVSPPLYYLLLHAWMGLSGGDSETLLRLPSVLAGVGLVAAVHWLGRLAGGRSAATLAAGLAVISPLVLMYAQQARAYVWVMLALTIAVAAALQATRDGSARLLALSALAAAGALALHYTALLVLAPLTVWLVCWSGAPARWRAAFVGCLGLVGLALVPLVLEQLGRGHHDATASYAALTPVRALALVGTPFDGRSHADLLVARELGALVVVDALALLAFGESLRRVAGRWLILACAATPLIVVIAFSALGQPLALTRYTAVAAPFIVVAIAVVAARVHRALGAALVVAAAIAALSMLVAAQQRDGQYSDTRGAVATAGAHWQDGDVLVSVGLLGFGGTLDYYAGRQLPPGAGRVLAYRDLPAATQAAEIARAAAAGRRLWVVSDPPLSSAQAADALVVLGYEPVAAREFAGSGPIQLIRAEPIR